MAIDIINSVKYSQILLKTLEKNSEYDLEIRQSHNTDQLTA